ncbi:hypothetical protein Tco_0629024 [Tanacetum coccineum]|uniref:Uncharacterized protein n=1 Tax=Tanacetum coccineum TaxID=301880 RepID=A0ABQ4WS33_9ASTR
MLYRSTEGCCTSLGHVDILELNLKVITIRFMMLRYVDNPSTNLPLMFDIDGRTLEFGRGDFCLITGFRFGKVFLDPKEKDNVEFHHRVFLMIANLNGKHLLDLVKKDLEFDELDDDNVVYVYLLLALDYVFMGQELTHTEVRHEVHVRTEVHRFVDEEEKVVDMQRCLLSLNQIMNTQNTGPSDVDHNVVMEGVNHSKSVDHLDMNVLVGGLDHQSMEGVSQCMNVVHLDKNWNDDSYNFPVDCLDHQSMEGVSQCMSVDHLDNNWNDKSESVAINGLISLRSQDVDDISKG